MLIKPHSENKYAYVVKLSLERECNEQRAHARSSLAYFGFIVIKYIVILVFIGQSHINLVMESNI